MNVYHRCYDIGDKLFSGVNDTGENFIAGVTNTWHGFTVIAIVVDTGDKFITGVNNTSEQFSPVTRTGRHGGGEKVEGDKLTI